MSFDVELVEGRIALAEGLNPFGTGQCLSTKKENKLLLKELVSIPLEQGNVFRLKTEEREFLIGLVSIPLEQGNVFRLDLLLHLLLGYCLNPFGTGQCLSTGETALLDEFDGASQSLWNRAMSFD